MTTRFLFPTRPDDTSGSVLLLLARIVFGGLLISHGIYKWIHFDTLATTFPDPFDFGSRTSLMLAIFAEVFCSTAFIAGFLYRLVLIPMMFLLFVAFFVVGAGAPFAQRELSLAYLCVFAFMYAAGAGRYSFDYLFSRSLKSRYDKGDVS